MIHVYPLNDNQEHETEGTSCPCGVRIEEGENGEMLVIHRSFNGREVIEELTEDVRKGMRNN